MLYIKILATLYNIILALIVFRSSGHHKAGHHGHHFNQLQQNRAPQKGHKKTRVNP